MTETKWYLEAKVGNEATNRAFASEIGDESLHQDALCHDGKKRNLWECSYQKVRYFQTARKNGAIFLQFTIWVQEGRGAIRPWGLQDMASKRRWRFGGKHPKAPVPRFTRP